jgi:hypothetical protein
MRTRILWLAACLAVLMVGAGACGGPRNCLVIPAQIDLVSERRAAALKDLETKANQVDRTVASIERVQQRLKDLQGEKAFLDSLPPGDQPAQPQQ